MRLAPRISLPLRGRNSARIYTIAIIIAVLAPPLTLAGYVAIGSARTERAHLEQSARDETREATAAIEREMIAAENVLATLADAPSLQSGDLEAFYNQASNAARRTGFVVVLRDAETERLVVSSNYPFGTTLYKAAQDPRTEAEKQLLRSGRSIVTGVFYGVLLKEYFVAIVMPVFKDGDVRYYLSAGIPVRRFSDILSSLHIHADQTVSVIDRNGLFVTRSHDPDAYVGTRSLRTFPAEVPSIYGAVNRNGIAFQAFNDASALLGWRISTKHA